MKYIILQNKRTGLVAFLLSIVFIMAACEEPSKPNNEGGGGGGTTADTLAAPVITSPPKSVTITEGSTATLSVAVTAVTGVTFTYQWQKAAKGHSTFTDVVGATSASYTTDTLRLAYSGVQYRVVVTAANTAGLKSNTTSSIAMITVTALPPAAHVITQQPASQAITEGSTATLSVAVTAVTGVTFTYQWQKAAKGATDFTNVEEATSNSYTTPVLAYTDSGVQYRVVVTATNTAGLKSNTTSSIAMITVTALPPVALVITQQPASQAITEGSTATLSVAVTDVTGVTFTYQWQKAAKGATDFTNVEEATSNSYTTPVLAYTDSGVQYRVVVTATNTAGLKSNTTSSIAMITVLPAKIVWTDINNVKHYAAVPTNGILSSRILTTTATDIKSVDTIPNGVTRIGTSAFWNCTGLTSITIPSNVTSIGGSAFLGCSRLASITIPNGVTTISQQTFYNCSRLTSITLPNGVSTIEVRAFYGCSGLTSITLPNSLTSIGDEVFSGCIGLTSITIPNGVTSIGNDAFYRCGGLTSITLPSSVTSIGRWAFESCRGLASVRVEATTPPTAVIPALALVPTWEAFERTAHTLSITVPSASVDAYKAASGWKDYADRISGY